MRILALLALLLVAGPAHADVVYTYEGGLFQLVSGEYTQADRVTGTLRLAGDVQPPQGAGAQYVPASAILDYRFTDGHQTLTPGNSSTSIWNMPGIALPFAVDGTPLDPTRAGYQLYFASQDGGIFINHDTDYYDSVVFGPSRWTRPNGTVGGVTAEYCSWECNYYSGGLPVNNPSPRWTVETIGVPERAILPKLPRLLKAGPGLGLEAAVTRQLQVATAWAAAALLGARRDGLFIDMPSVRLEVAEACSGMQTLLVMLLVAGLIAGVHMKAHAGIWWYIPALATAAVLLALEANALRVAGIAVALEHLGSISTLGKDWMQYGTTGVALAQLVGLGRLVAR